MLFWLCIVYWAGSVVPEKSKQDYFLFFREGDVMTRRSLYFQFFFCFLFLSGWFDLLLEKQGKNCSLHKVTKFQSFKKNNIKFTCSLGRIYLASKILGRFVKWAKSFGRYSFTSKFEFRTTNCNVSNTILPC